MARVQRTRLCDRVLPDYTHGEELMNTVTHIVGGGFAIVALVLCVVFAARNHNAYGIVSSAVYGASMIALYTVSSVYHGLKPGMGKMVMQVVDHCTIYFLIAGTYTVMALSALRPAYPRCCIFLAHPILTYWVLRHCSCWSICRYFRCLTQWHWNSVPTIVFISHLYACAARLATPSCRCCWEDYSPCICITSSQLIAHCA